jgi:hypothetical protein
VIYTNPKNPLGNLASLDTELRRLERYAEEAQAECARKQKALADYREQLGRPFEQEERLRELLGKQATINRALDLDKGDTQVGDEEKVA